MPTSKNSCSWDDLFQLSAPPQRDRRRRHHRHATLMTASPARRQQAAQAGVAAQPALA